MALYSAAAATGAVSDNLIPLLAFMRLPGVSASRYWRLYAEVGPARQILQTPPERLKHLLGELALETLSEAQANPEHPIFQQATQDYEWCKAHQVRILSTEDDDYPRLLREIPQPPPLLYVKGALANLSLPQLAVVGSRTPTPSGLDNSAAFSRALSLAGFVITSGLALGVDGAAHRGALEGGGATVAVLGTGIDRVYPARHRQLAESIVAQGGTLISEFPLGTPPLPAHFPQRNRIISGLCLGVLVVEAAVKSGSLITARYALQSGREVFAIPGSIHNPLSRGCHALLKEGATLVEQVTDLRDHLQGLLAWEWQVLDAPPPSESEFPLTPEEQEILEAVGYEATSLDTLQRRTQKPTSDLLGLLTNLELKDRVTQTAAGYQRR